MKRPFAFAAGVAAAAGITYAAARRKRGAVRISLTLADGATIDLAPSSLEALELRVAAAGVRRALEGSS